MDSPEKSSVFLPHGGYRKLRSYKVAEAVYDATVVFCRRFFARDRRTQFGQARLRVRELRRALGELFARGAELFEMLEQTREMAQRGESRSEIGD